ncbi:CAP domain-containing protein [Algihabitans albus]|uniref:CAP domain-containing protein n=1 Tax=Algihabitans albus TaxID=2164067 RepID=UPI000E5C992C|nr:CAP domain-containing protein [Algihabitans albus]
MRRLTAPIIALLLLYTVPASADPASELLRRINSYRESLGLTALNLSAKLEAAALAHDADMATQNYFAHRSPDGHSLKDRLEALGYAFHFAAENLAGGQRTPREVLESWKDSLGHNTNLLMPRVTEAGVAFSRNPQGRPIRWLWTLVLAEPLE